MCVSHDIYINYMCANIKEPLIFSQALVQGDLPVHQTNNTYFKKCKC